MYDLVIVGAGPSGLTASIYASCFNLNHLVIGKILGGQMSMAPDIINYPGFEEISGEELTEKMTSQVKKRGAEIIIDTITKIEKIEQGFSLSTEGGKNYQSKAIILATGAERRKLNIPGENEYIGKGVSYCAICEKIEYQNKNVAVIGGGNGAASAAVKLMNDVSKVYLIYRGNELRCDPILLEQIKNNPKVEILYNTEAEEILGDGQKLTGLKLKLNPSSNLSNPLLVEKVFVEIGGVPGSTLAISTGAQVEQNGYVKVDENLATSVPGIFAAGDIVSYGLSVEQISSAVGLGGKAATSVFSYLKQQKAPNLWGQNQINR